jgi:ribosomal protein S18 acetylase RimI-like enzyme
MPEVRRADPDDAAELTRLRVVMFTDMGRDLSFLDDDWRRRNVTHFRRRLAETDVFAAYVVDRPDGGLAASAIGWLNDHLIGTTNPVGKVGYIANMCTDPAYRRRGYGRATLVALLSWLRSTGITTVDLHATPDGEPLYRSLGFTAPTDPALTLRLQPRTSARDRSGEQGLERA